MMKKINLIFFEPNRRDWIKALASGSILAMSTHGITQVLLGETEPQAKALGYVSDASKVDRGMQPKFNLGQACNNCNFFKIGPEASTGTCKLFSGRRVSAVGWCSGYQAVKVEASKEKS